MWMPSDADRFRFLATHGVPPSNLSSNTKRIWSGETAVPRMDQLVSWGPYLSRG
jgi:hypothetical protein